MTRDTLFPAPVQSPETDERYTPPWIFEALGETFDLDPASPPLGVSRVPTAAVWTKDDDGLTQPWHGFVWLNPPFSVATPWADRFIAHGCGIWLGPVANSDWHIRMTRTSDAMILLRDFAFIGVNHAQKRSSMPLSLHGYGQRAVAALRRFSERQPDAGVLLGRKSRWSGPVCSMCDGIGEDFTYSGEPMEVSKRDVPTGLPCRACNGHGREAST